MEENPSIKDLRKFKITLLFFPIIPSLIFYFKNHVTLAVLIVEVCWAILLTMLIPRLFGKNVDKLVYKIVRVVLNAIGAVISAIALVFTWICAILPTAVVAKLKGRDRLLLKKTNVKSYWKDFKESDPTYENQY